jgi:PPOX class probable F420-dependent enzyme
MPEPTDHAAFLAANRFCVLGTLRRDGRARLSPMGYVYEDGNILISTTRSRGAGRTARREPRVTVCVFDPANTGKYLTAYGTAEVVEDEALTIKIFSQFRGHALAGDELTDLRAMIAREGRVVLVITPNEFFPR